MRARSRRAAGLPRHRRCSLGRPLAEVVDDYVRRGLAANLGLQAATLEVERSQAALDAARGRFFPEVALDARYTRAEGGRQVDLPFARC
jgi:outer membrane protein TolC